MNRLTWTTFVLAGLLLPACAELGDPEPCADPSGYCAGGELDVEALEVADDAEDDRVPTVLSPVRAWEEAERMEAEDGVSRTVVWTATGPQIVPYQDVDGQAVVGGDHVLGPVAGIADARERGAAYRDVWFPDGRIRYFTTDMTGAQATAIDTAVAFLGEHTPLDVAATTESSANLELRSTNANNYCGMAYDYWDENDKNPVIRLSTDCTASAGTVLHELGHGLGFPHEFQRSDRDSFVSVCGKKTYDMFNYGKMGSLYWPDPFSLLSPFDFASIMNSGYKSCVTPLSPNTWIDREYDGDSTPLSVHDVNSIYRVYAEPLGSVDDGLGFGAAVASGDFDDDGLEDVVIATNEARDGSSLNRIYLNFYRGVATDASEGGAGMKHVAWFRAYHSTTTEADLRPALAVGDFDGEGIDDLAVGDPSYAGGLGRIAVYTINTPDRFAGAAPWGSRTYQSRTWITATAAGLQSGHAHRFGAALAAGRLSSSTRDDLVVGAPAARKTTTSTKLEVPMIVERGGAVVHLRYATTPNATITWNPGTAGADFGHAVTVMPRYCPIGTQKYGTFVAGAPGNDGDRGAIHLYGCARNNTGYQVAPALVKSVTSSSVGSRYGHALAAFNTVSSIASDTWRYYLAIGAPYRVVNSVRSGSVFLDSFDLAGNKTWVATYTPGTTSGNDEFGFSLAAYVPADPSDMVWGNVNIAIGIPGTRNSSGVASGKVYLWHPWVSGSISKASTILTPSTATNGMRYGETLAAVNLPNDGGFAIGAPLGVANAIEYQYNLPVLVQKSAGQVQLKLNKGSNTSWSSSTQNLTIATGADRAPTN